MIKETDGQSAKSGEATFQIGDDSKLIFLICDTIWATENKTVVEHELKRKLGFCKRQGHRTWRRLQKKMIDSGLITAFKAIVDGSEVKCIRQLIVSCSIAIFFYSKCFSRLLSQKDISAWWGKINLCGSISGTSRMAGTKAAPKRYATSSKS